jgi:DnaJ-class molecular chaperone
LSAPAGAASGASDLAETHYQLLGVPVTATQAEIARAYRRQMKRFHPDRARPERRAAAEEQARRLNAAYRTLSQPTARRAYDERIKHQAIQEQIMGRYVGGFAGPGMEAGGAFGAALRREMSQAERRERAEAGRSATATVLVAFVALTAAIVALILVFSLAGWVFDALF